MKRTAWIMLVLAVVIAVLTGWATSRWIERDPTLYSPAARSARR
jgi:hypothetical protein